MTSIFRKGQTYSKMARLAAVVAATAGSSAAQAKGRAISLDVTQTLAVVALLSLGGTGQGAAVGLMACCGILVYVDGGQWQEKAIPGCLPINQVSMCEIFRVQSQHTVVAETLSRGANLGIVANIAALVASSSRKRRHDDICLWRS